MKPMIPIEYNNQRMLTTELLAENYEATESKIVQNFNNNINRYEKGKHYFLLEGEELRAFKREVENFDIAPNVNKLYLWTEKGALLHAKSLNTDVAWQVYEELVETYFKVKESPLFIDTSKLSPEMQMFNLLWETAAKTQLAHMELQRKVIEVENKVDVIKDTIIQRDSDWRKSLNKIFNSAVEASGTKDFQAFRRETYDILEERAHCDLNKRLRFLRERLAEQGATKTKINETTKLDVIENDVRLKEIYTSIVKELSVKHSLTAKV